MILGNQKMIALYFREERYFPEALRARLLEAERAVTSKLSKVIDSGIRRGDFRSCDSQLLALNVTGMISMAFYWTRSEEHKSELQSTMRNSSDVFAWKKQQQQSK